jgi:hypothetical protein
MHGHYLMWPISFVTSCWLAGLQQIAYFLIVGGSLSDLYASFIAATIQLKNNMFLCDTTGKKYLIFFKMLMQKMVQFINSKKVYSL